MVFSITEASSHPERSLVSERHIEIRKRPVTLSATFRPPHGASGPTPEIGPPRVRVLPAHDNGREEDRPDEATRSHAGADPPQPARGRAGARRGCESPRWPRHSRSPSKPSIAGELSTRHESRRRPAPSRARARERSSSGSSPTRSSRTSPSRRSPRELVSPARRRGAVCMLQRRRIRAANLPDPRTGREGRRSQERGGRALPAKTTS